MKREIRVHTTTHGSQKVHLIEVPSFIKGDHGDPDWFQDLTYWLVMSYKHRGITLSGIVYVCYVADPSIDNDMLHNSLCVFSDICGPHFYPSVVLARAAQSARGKASTLPEGRRDTKQLWDHIVESGATEIQLPWNTGSALATIAHLVDKDRRMPLQLQSEIVDHGMPVNLTGAGRAIDNILRKAKGQYRPSNIFRAWRLGKVFSYQDTPETTGQSQSRVAEHRGPIEAFRQARHEEDSNALMRRVRPRHIEEFERLQHELYLSETRLLEFEASYEQEKYRRETELEQAREDHGRGGNFEWKLKITQKFHDLDEQASEEALTARRAQHHDLQTHILQHAAWQEIMFKRQWEERQRQTALNETSQGSRQYDEKISKILIDDAMKVDDASVKWHCSVM